MEDSSTNNAAPCSPTSAPCETTALRQSRTRRAQRPAARGSETGGRDKESASALPPHQEGHSRRSAASIVPRHDTDIDADSQGSGNHGTSNSGSDSDGGRNSSSTSRGSTSLAPSSRPSSVYSGATTLREEASMAEGHSDAEIVEPVPSGNVSFVHSFPKAYHGVLGVPEGAYTTC